MKEIKFRAWDKAHKEIKQVLNLFISEDMIQCDEDEYAVYNSSNFELMQYTGRKDKKNIEIYEGDVVSNEIIKGYVASNHLCFVVYDKNTDFIPMYKLDTNTLEVIGNIYDNPELSL